MKLDTSVLALGDDALLLSVQTNETTSGGLRHSGPVGLRVVTQATPVCRPRGRHFT